MKKSRSLFLSLLLVLQLFIFPMDVNAKTIIKWSEVQKGTYSSLYLYTFRWSGDVFSDPLIQGMNLSSKKITNKIDEIDVVINQYGSIAANGIIELNEKLENDTEISKYKNFNSTASYEAGKVFLVITSDGGYVKIRIDQVLPTKVLFSYVTVKSTEEVPENVTAPANQTQSQNQTQTSNQTQTQVPTQNHTQTPPNTSAGSSGSGAYSPIQQDSGFFIELQINSYKSNINGTAKMLDVPPVVVNDRTLVPLRFISESLGASVKWYDSDRSVLITYNGNSITLWIDNPIAKVRGENVRLDVPAQIINDRTMVPLRFISENFDKEVVYYVDSKIIQIKNKGYGSVSGTSTGTAPDTSSVSTTGSGSGSVPDTSHGTTPDTSNGSTPDTGSGSADSVPDTYVSDISGIFGKWSIWTPGGFSYTTDGYNNYMNYNPGIGGETIEIRSDGTYTWTTVGGKVIEGSWSREGSTALLYSGDYGWDWYVSEHDWSDGKGIKVSTYGAYREGRRIK